MERKRIMLILICLILILLIGIFTGFFENVGRMTGKVIYEDEERLLAYYQFENDVEDSAGHNNGLNHGASFSRGKVGNAIIFDGIDDRVSVAGIDTKMFNDTSSFTLSTWYMPTSDVFAVPDGKQAYFFGGTNNPYGLLFTKENEVLKLGHAYWVQDPDGGYTLISDVQDIENLSEWYYVSSTYDLDSKNLCLYINGKLISCKGVSGYGGVRVIRGNSKFKIGGMSPGYTSPAKLDEAKIWNYDLSEEEIELEYLSYFEEVGEEVEGEGEVSEEEKPTGEFEGEQEEQIDETEGEGGNLKLWTYILIFAALVVVVLYFLRKRKENI